MFVKEVEKSELENTLANDGNLWDLRDRFKNLKKTKNYKEKFVEEMAHITAALDLQKETEELKQYMPTKIKSEDKREEGKGFLGGSLGSKSKSKGVKKNGAR